MKEEVGYEEFLAAVYEAETEGMEGKILNVKVKAMTVEKVVEKKEPTDFQDIKQQIELLATIMKSTTMGSVKLKEGDWGFIPKEERNVLKFSLRKYSKDHLRREKGFLNQDGNL